MCSYCYRLQAAAHEFNRLSLISFYNRRLSSVGPLSAHNGRSIKRDCETNWGLTVAKIAVVTVSPMAKGAEPLISLRFSSQTPKTTSTKVKVLKNSTPKPWVGVRNSCTVVTPSVLWNFSGVSDCPIKLNWKFIGEWRLRAVWVDREQYFIFIFKIFIFWKKSH